MYGLDDLYLFFFVSFSIGETPLRGMILFLFFFFRTSTVSPLPFVFLDFWNDYDIGLTPPPHPNL